MTLAQILQLQAYLHNSVVVALLILPAILIILDVLTGVTSALKHGSFNLKLLTDFLGNDFLKYVVLFAVIVVAYYLSGASVATSLATDVGLPLLSLTIFSSVIQNLGEISPALAQIGEQLGAMVGLKPIASPVVPVATVPEPIILPMPEPVTTVVQTSAFSGTTPTPETIATTPASL